MNEYESNSGPSVGAVVAGAALGAAAIYVLRTEKGKDYRFSIDYDAVLKGEHMEMNIPLLAGDTVVVPH